MVQPIQKNCTSLSQVPPDPNVIELISQHPYLSEPTYDDLTRAIPKVYNQPVQGWKAEPFYDLAHVPSGLPSRKVLPCLTHLSSLAQGTC